MARLELRPFSEDFVPARGSSSPPDTAPTARPSRCCPSGTRTRLPRAPRSRRCSPSKRSREASALRDGRVVGYLLGAPRPTTVWGDERLDRARRSRRRGAGGPARPVRRRSRPLGGSRTRAALRDGPGERPGARQGVVTAGLRPAARPRDPRGPRRAVAGRRPARRGARRRRARRAWPAPARPSGAVARLRPRVPGRDASRSCAPRSSRISQSPRSATSSPSATAASSARSSSAPPSSPASTRGSPGPREPCCSTGRRPLRRTRVRRWRRAYRGLVRLGPRARTPDDRGRLARDEPALVPLLAGARLSGDVPASLPAHSVVPRIPILSDSRLAVVNAPDDAIVLRPPPPSEAIADVGAAVRDALRFPLSGSPLEALTRPGGTVTLVVEPPELPLPGRTRTIRDAMRSRPRSTSSSGWACGRSARRSSSPAASTGAPASASSRTSSRPSTRAASTGESRCTTSRLADLVHLGDVDDTPLRVNRQPAPRRTSSSRDRGRDRSCTAARARCSAPADRRRFAPRAPTHWSRRRAAAAGSSRSHSSARSVPGCR